VEEDAARERGTRCVAVSLSGSKKERVKKEMGKKERDKKERTKGKRTPGFECHLTSSMQSAPHDCRPIAG
jgi:hypothetical protein